MEESKSQREEFEEPIEESKHPKPRGSHKGRSHADEFELQQEMAHNLVELARVEEQELKI
jgi:hypothetical protein